MKQERYCVYEELEPMGGGDDVEISWHYSPDTARQNADAGYRRTGQPHRVDLNVVEITRDGAECIDSDPDLYGIGYPTRSH